MYSAYHELGTTTQLPRKGLVICYAGRGHQLGGRRGACYQISRTGMHDLCFLAEHWLCLAQIGRAPLHVAAQTGNLESLIRLLDAGAGRAPRDRVSHIDP